jgi:nitroreductase
MTLKELVLAARSCRRFHQGRAVPLQDLQDLVDMARLTPSAANLQPLKYVLSASPEINAAIFPCLGWAAYLKDWPGPEEGERPAAYIVLLGDTAISDNVEWDHGIAAQTIQLGATEKGLGACMLGSLNRNKLRQILDLPEGLDILLVLALGVPAETRTLEPVGTDGSIKYYRDETEVHHVPKRSLAEVLVAVYS